MEKEFLTKTLPLTVGFAVPGDESSLLRLYRSLIGSPYCTWDDEYPDEETVREDVARGATLLARDAQGQIAAALTLLPEGELPPLPIWDTGVRSPAEFARLGVRADWQRKGVARALLLHAMHLGKLRGADGVRLIAAKTNAAALALYASLGFSCAGEAALFGMDWYCLELRLA